MYDKITRLVFIVYLGSMNSLRNIIDTVKIPAAVALMAFAQQGEARSVDIANTLNTSSKTHKIVEE